MKITNFKSIAVALFFALATPFFLVSCNDKMEEDSYYTTVKEYAADYLSNREQFSQYIEILKRATGERGDLRLYDMLATYGQYTVFAPTNDVVNKYLAERHMSSVAELSKEDCDTIALNSIIEASYFTTDYSNAEYPKANMLEHIMSINADSLVDPATGDVKLQLKINKTSLLTHYDDSVCNGVVHTVGDIVTTSNDMLPQVMKQDTLISIFNDALHATGIDELLLAYVDESYGFATNQDRLDSCTWKNDKLCIHTAQEYDNVAYPEKRYYNFTVFAVKNQILRDKYGVTDVDGLYDLAKTLYKPMYPEDEGVTEYTDRRNYLNRFISYHILDRLGLYYKLTAIDGGKLSNNFNRRKWDVADWYQTLMPHSSMKVSFPSGSQQGIYINRRGVQSRADEQGIFVRGAKVATKGDGPLQPTAVNGIYHYIDDIIAYDEQTQNVVLNERIRMDCTTLSPDFMTKLTDGEMARGHLSANSANNYMYGAGGQGEIAANNKDHCVGFKAGYCRNFEYTDNTHLHVRGRVLGYWSYGGDEVTIKGPFDVTLRLLPVPAGTYEVRMMTCTGFASRGIMQAYIDGVPQGIPFDMRPGGAELFGTQEDAAIGDEDAITAFDKAVHNIGWMKGPDCYSPGEKDSFSGTTMRNLPNTIRKVLGHFTTDGKSDHYLRLQQKMESGGEMNFDFIEIVPSSVYNNEYYPETKW